MKVVLVTHKLKGGSQEFLTNAEEQREKLIDYLKFVIQTCDECGAKQQGMLYSVLCRNIENERSARDFMSTLGSLDLDNTDRLNYRIIDVLKTNDTAKKYLKLGSGRK